MNLIFYNTSWVIFILLSFAFKTSLLNLIDSFETIKFAKIMTIVIANPEKNDNPIYDHIIVMPRIICKGVEINAEKWLPILEIFSQSVWL